MEDSERADLERLVVFLRGEVPGATALSASIYCTVAPAWETDIHLVVSLERTGMVHVADGCKSAWARIGFTFRVANTALLVFEYLKQYDSTLTDLNLRFSFCPFSPSYYDGRRAEWLSDNGFVREALAAVSSISRLSSLGITFSADGDWMSSGRGQCRGIMESWGRHFFETNFPRLESWRNPSFENLTLTALEHQSTGSRVGDAESYAARNFGALPDGNYRLTRAYYFSRHSALEFWTLTTSRSCDGWKHHGCFPLRDFVTRFPAVDHSDGAWSVANNRLVLRSTLSNRVRGLCRGALVSLVANQVWLERLEAGKHPFLRDDMDHTRAMARALPCRCQWEWTRALACSPSVEKFGPYRCSLAELREVVRVFVPDAYGRQANTSLSTLKLCLQKTTQVLDFMTALKPLLESNYTTTLKRVELCSQKRWRFTLLAGSSSQVPDAGADRHSGASLSVLCLSETTHTLLPDCTTLLNTLLALNSSTWKHVKLSWPELKMFSQPTLPLTASERVVHLTIQNLLEQMVENELRRNTCLQSLCVGWWELLRVAPGDRWEMRYTGPCIRSPGVQQKEYVVKVRLR